MHPAVDAAGQVHAQEGQLGVGHRVDQPPHEVGRAVGQLAVLAPERHDAHRRLVAQQARDPVGVQPGAADHGIGRQLAAGGLDHDLARTVVATDDLGARQEARTSVAQPPDEDIADGAVVDDAGLRHVQRGDGRDVGLVLAGRDGREPGDRQAVGEPALLQGREPLELVARGGHDELAGHPVRHALGPGECEHRRRPGPAPARLAASGRVVQARVQDAAVAAGLVARPVLLLLDDGHDRRGVLPQHPLGHGQPQDAAPDDDDAAAAGHGIRQRLSLRRAAAMIRAYSRPESFTVRTCVS